jgi:F-box and WD-40 domain protein 1/11
LPKMAEQRPTTTKTMQSRVFAVSDWAPVQEAALDDDAASSSTAAAATVVVTVDSRNENRIRSMSHSLLGRRPRPESFVFPASQTVNQDSLALHLGGLDVRSPNDEQTLSPSSGSNMNPKNKNTHGHSRSVSAAAPVPGGFKTLMRRASMSLKGMVHHSKRHSVAHHPDNTTNSGDFPRPVTSHALSPSPWQRLRHAAHLGHHRASHGAAELERPRFVDPFPSSSALPTPGSSAAPPYIPRNTGGAAKAAAAAAQQYQNQYQGRQVSPPPALRNRNWLGDFGVLRKNNSNDRESGIGIMVTGPDEAAADTDTAVDDDEDQDVNVSGLQDANISRVDFVARVPVELAIQILSCLDCAALASASLVSRRWNDVVASQHVWRESFLRAKTTTYATGRAVAPGTALGVPAVKPEVNWRELYRVREELDHSWKIGSAKPIYLNGHQDSIYCLQFDE